jgi:hypothetical protein
MEIAGSKSYGGDTGRKNGISARDFLQKSEKSQTKDLGFSPESTGGNGCRLLISIFSFAYDKMLAPQIAKAPVCVP